jgi:peptidyl-prolyl cis-trans isomerase D
MLKTMRRNVKALKPTLWIIIATFIIAIFAIWGGAGRLGETGKAGTLATIGRERITSDAYFQTLRQRLEAMKREYTKLDRGLIQQLNVPQQVLQQIVEQALLLQVARDMRLGATDKEVRDRIISYPVFQKDGRFIGFNEYKQVLDWNRIPLAQFESGLKKEIAVTKVVQLLTSGVAVSDEEVWANYRKQNETAKIEYLVAETGKIEVAEQPDAAAVQAFFEKDKARYRIPETRTADYIFFKTADLKKEVKIDPAEIEKYYRDNMSQFQDPEKIKVSRVWLPFSATDKAAVLAEAEDVRKRAEAGADFAELARKHSRDDKAKDGGDWGVSAWASLSARETEEIRKLEAGRVSGIVEIEGGAAVLKVTEKTAEVTRPLDEVLAVVKGTLEDQKARELAAEKATRIERAARKQKSLDVAAQREGLKVKSSAALKQGDALEDFDPTGSVSQTLFTLKDKVVSAPIYTYTGVALAQLRKIEPDRPAKLEEVRDRVARDILDVKKREQALEKLNGVRAELRDNWEEAAQKNGLQLKTVEAHKHEQYISLVGESAEVDDLVFSLPVREPSRPVAVEGGYALFRVLERKEVVRADFDKVRDAEKSTLLETQKNKFLQSFLAKARDDKKVKVNYDLFLKVNTDVLNRFTGTE